MENKHQKVKKYKYTHTNLQAARWILQKGMRLKSQKTESQNLLQLVMLPMHRNKI